MISCWRHGEGNDDPDHSDPEDIYGQNHLEVIIFFRGLFDAHLLIPPSLLRFCQVAWHEGLLNHPWERLCLNWPGMENEEKQVKELTTTWPRFRYNLVSAVRSPRLIWIFYLLPECKFIFSWCVPVGKTQKNFLSVCLILLPSTMMGAMKFFYDRVEMNMIITTFFVQKIIISNNHLYQEPHWCCIASINMVFI